jgi:hypothetical protein
MHHVTWNSDASQLPVRWSVKSRFRFRDPHKALQLCHVFTYFIEPLGPFPLINGVCAVNEVVPRPRLMQIFVCSTGGNGGNIYTLTPACFSMPLMENVKEPQAVDRTPPSSTMTTLSSRTTTTIYLDDLRLTPPRLTVSFVVMSQVCVLT